MIHLVESWTQGKFSVILHREDDNTAHIMSSCDGTRLSEGYFDTLKEARDVFNTMRGTMRDVIACVKQDPSCIIDSDVVHEIELEENDPCCTMKPT